MSGREMKKYTGVVGKDRWDIFLDRIKTGAVFTYHPRRGTAKDVYIRPTNNQALIDALVKKSPSDYVTAFNMGVEAFDVNTGTREQLNSPYDLLKDAAFGSKDPFQAEKIQVDGLKTHLASLVGEENHIRVYVGPNKGIVPVDEIKHVVGGQKEDIILLFKKSPVAYVSLKSANSSKNMMQWGGISYLVKPKKGQPVKTYGGEASAFVSDAKTYFKNHGVTDVYRFIEDKRIAFEAVYGENGHVDLVSASKVPAFELDPQYGPGVYRFSGTVFYNSDIPDRDWTPIFMAMPSSSRNNFGIGGGRVGIYPLGFATARGAVEI